MKTLKILFVGLAIAVVAISGAQTAPTSYTLADISSGKIPLKLKIAEMTDDYKAIRLDTGSAGSGWLGMFTGMFSLGGGLDAISASYTKFERVLVDGRAYYVTYSTEIKTPGFMGAGSAGGSEPAIGSEISLMLVAVDSVASIKPLAATVADLRKAASTSATDLMSALTGQSSSGPSSESAKRTSELSNMKQLGIATMMYAADYDDRFPLASSTDQAKEIIKPYLKSLETWKVLNPNGGRILYNVALSGKTSASIDRPAETVLFFEEMAWPDGKRIVVYADGHAKLETAEVWADLRKQVKKSLGN